MPNTPTEITYKSSVYTSDSSHRPINVPGKVWVETDENDEVSALKVFGPSRTSNKWEVITSKVDDSKLSSNIPSSIQGESNKVVNVVNHLYREHIAENLQAGVDEFNTLMGTFENTVAEEVESLIQFLPSGASYQTKGTVIFSARNQGGPVYITNRNITTFADMKSKSFELLPGQKMQILFDDLSKVYLAGSDTDSIVDIIVLLDYIQIYKEPILLKNTTTGNWHQITVAGSPTDEDNPLTLYINDEPESSDIIIPSELRMYNETIDKYCTITLEGTDETGMYMVITPITENSE